MSSALRGARRHRELALAGVDALGTDGVAVALRQLAQAEVAEHAPGIHLVKTLAHEWSTPALGAARSPAVE